MPRYEPVGPVCSGARSRPCGPGCTEGTPLTTAAALGLDSGPTGPQGLGDKGACDAHDCLCRRCLRENVLRTKKKRHGDRNAAVARLREAVAARQAARERAQAAHAKCVRARAKRHRHRRRRRDAARLGVYACCKDAACMQAQAARLVPSDTDAGAGTGERQPEASGGAVKAAALKDAAAHGRQAVVAMLTTMIRANNTALLQGAGGAPDPEVDGIIAVHYNDLEAADKFELLLARMSCQPVGAAAPGAGVTRSTLVEGSCEPAS